MKKNIFEEIEENVLDFSNFEEFDKADKSNYAFFYHVTNERGMNGISRQGCADWKRFLKGQCYGRGIYGTWDDTWPKQLGAYGYCVIKFIVKNNYKNFIMFDKNAASIFKGGKTPEEQCRELLTDEQMKEMNRLIKESCNFQYRQKYDWNYFNNWSVPSQYRWEEWEKIVLKLLPDLPIDGIGCKFGNGANMVVAHSLDCLLPYEICSNGHVCPPKWEYVVTKNRFKRFNDICDLEYKFGSRYPATTNKEPLGNGFGRVLKNETIGNYVSTKQEKTIFYSDVINPTSVSQFCTSRFEYVTQGQHYTLDIIFNNDDTVKIVNNANPLDPKVISLEKLNRIMRRDEMLKKQSTMLQEGQFTNKTREEFMSGKDNFISGAQSGDKFRTHGNFYVYHVTPIDSVNPRTGEVILKNSYDNILKNNFTTDFSGLAGDPALYHGLGAYTFYDFHEGAMKHLGYAYGKQPVIIKFLLKDGLKDFIIFDDRLRKKWDPKSSPLDEMKRLVDPEALQMIDASLKNCYNDGRISNGVFHYRNKTTGKAANLSLKNDGIKIFDYDNLKTNDEAINDGKGGKNGFMSLVWKVATEGEQDRSNGLTHLYKETLLAHSRNRGTVYYGGNDGPCVFVRDLSSLIPVAYMKLERGNGYGWHETKWVINPYLEKKFDYFNNNVLPFYSYRKDYPNIKYNAKTMHIPFGNNMQKHICRVEKNNGVNYIDTVTDEKIFPFDLEEGTDFMPLNRTATIKFKKLKSCFELKIDDDGSFYLLNLENPTRKLPLQNVINSVLKRYETLKQNARPLNEGITPTISVEGWRKKFVLLDNDEMRLNQSTDDNGNEYTLFSDAINKKFNNTGLNIVSFFELMCQKQGITNITSKKQQFTAVYDLVESIASLKIFANESTLRWARYRLFGERITNNEDYIVNLINQKVERHINRRDQIVKILNEKFEKFYNEERAYTLDAYNFFKGYLKNYPQGVEEGIETLAPSKQNKILKPYFDANPYKDSFLKLKQKLFDNRMGLRCFKTESGTSGLKVETLMFGDAQLKGNDSNIVDLPEDSYNYMQAENAKRIVAGFGYDLGKAKAKQFDNKIYFLLRKVKNV